jgi:hypothetical protein
LLTLTPSLLRKRADCESSLAGNRPLCHEALIIGNQIMKFGKAGSKGSTLGDRMRGTASSGNEAWLFAEGRPIGNAGWQRRKLDKFKREIPSVIRAQLEIEVWAGAFTATTFEDKERELNATFNPPWVDRKG